VTVDHVTIRVPQPLADTVWRALQSRWRVSRSQAVEQALLMFIKLRQDHPDLPLAPEQPHPLTNGSEVWVRALVAEAMRDMLREHRNANPDAPRIGLGMVTQTALQHALASLEAHGHVTA
jgi:metal-responsive CopG/Arc/MetJ family transcriptional regulator